MAGRDRAINMPLRVVGIDGVKRDFAEMGRSGSDALNDIGKTAEKAFRNSETSIQRMKNALAEAKAIAGRTYDTVPGGATSTTNQQNRRGFIRDQLRTAKAGIAEDARAFGAAAQAKAAEAALGGADEAAGRFGLSLGRLGGAGGIAAAGIGLVVAAGGILASKADEDTRSLERFTTQLALAGNGSGLTAAQLEALGRSASAASGQTVDAIRQAEAAIINMPGVTGPAFDAVIESAARLAGKLGTDVAAEAEKAGAIVSAIATQDMAALEKAVANLDPVLQNAILKLADAGKTSEATAVYLKALAEAAGDGPSGLAAETNKLTNSWNTMLGEWGRTTGVADLVNSAIRGIGAGFDWLASKAAIAGPVIRSMLLPPGAGTGAAPGAGGQLQTPNWIQDDRAWRDARRQESARMGLADRALDDQLKSFGRTQAERKRQADIEFARTKLAGAGLQGRELETRAQQYAARAEQARAAAAAREPGAVRRRQSAAERAARSAETARQRAVRNQQQFDQQSATLDSALIGAKRANTTDAEQLAKFARDQIATEAEKTADTIRSREKLRQYTAAQAAELLAKNEQVKAEKLKTVETNLAREVARDALALATARLDNDSALLKLQEPMARTAAAQRALQIKQLDIDVRKERLALESTVALGQAGDVDVEIAKAKLRILDQLKAGEAAAIKLSTQGPLEEYWSSLPRTIDEVGEAMERVRVDQLRKLNEDTREFADTFSGAFGRAAGDLARFKNPLEIGKNLLGDMADLFTRQFVEQPATDWVRRRAGGSIAERLVGGTSGDYGLNAQQMNAAMTGTTVELNAFSIALQQARMSVGPAAMGLDPLAALPAANDNLDALAGESAAAAAALRAQLPTIGQFGTGLAQVLSMLGGAGGGGIGGLAGLILGVAGSAFGGGTTSAGTGVVYGGNLGGIYHTGTRGRGVGPGGARRSIGAADMAMAPRLHRGTLGSDEFAAILKRKEEVLSPWQSSALRDFMSNGGRPANDGPSTIMPVVNINAPQPVAARRVGAVVGRSVQLAAGRAGRKGLAAPKRSRP